MLTTRIGLVATSLCVAVAGLFGTNEPTFGAEPTTIDGRVVQFQFPYADVEVRYVETRGSMSMVLLSTGCRVSGPRFWIGDGNVAVLLVGDGSDGIRLQGATAVEHGTMFRKDSTIQVKPGYKRAVDLGPGDTYLILSGVKFELPKK